MHTEAFLARLKNPPKCYRPIPFWSWNEKLDVTETRRQIAEMDEAGIGGYFMHARGGLQTEYMAEEWMANVAASIDEGRQRGMGAWAYDENGWPSGFGNGRVNGKGLDFQQKYLRWEDADTRESGGADREITMGKLPDGRRLRFFFDVNPFYVDTLDASVVADFLREIYDPYAERFGKDLGKAMPGFFTDEPQVSRNGIPWSFALPAAYSQAYGEDLLPLLPALFFEEGNWRRTRYRFWHLVQELFVTAFTEQIYTWCEEHGCSLTGHMVLEETLLSQLTSNGAVMPHFEFFHIPGMDWLGRHIDPPTTPLQVASVAHQLGIRQVLSETFALTGWNVSFEELKWMYEWQMVRGVTLLCQHLEGYSLRGIRKRDYPPSLFYQQPWWDRYRFFNDAMSRMGMLLSDGEARFDVLVIHPQSSAWIDFDNGDNGDIGERYQAFLELTRALETAHVPFHYGDERILRRHGSVEADRLRVGRCTYSVVVVPPVLTLAASTAELLRGFSEVGGHLLWSAGGPPELIEGEPGELAKSLGSIGRLVAGPAEAIEALPATARRIRVRGPQGEDIRAITVTERVFSDSSRGKPFRMVYLVNSDLGKGYDASIVLPGLSVCRFVMESGDMAPIAFEHQDGEVRIPWSFPPAGSLALFVSDTEEAYAPAPATKPARRPLTAAELGGNWNLELRDPNALTLDVCDIHFDGVLVAENEHISVVQERALRLERPVTISLGFKVQAEEGWVPPSDCCLVLEQPERVEASVNGQRLKKTDLGAFRDRSFRRLDLEGALHSGSNTILLETRFTQPAEVYENLRRARMFEAEKNKLTYDSEIEAVYLAGSFGVATPGQFHVLPRGAVRYDGPFLLCDLPQQVQPSDLTTAGLPFAAGTVRLRRELELTAADALARSFRFEALRGHHLSLTVNGCKAGEWFWRPFEADLDGLLRPGRNVIELQLTGGLRNLLGPHHLQQGESYAVGPASFFKEPNIWGSQPWDDAYCFVGFGVVF